MERYRISPEAAVYFVTYSVVEWLPVFVSEAACRILTESLIHCDQEKSLATNAFVVMPTHFHAIFFDKEFNSERLSGSLADFRKYTGRNLADYCVNHMPSCFGATFQAAANDDRDRRFWQPSRHPEAISTVEFWSQKLDYLHANPCRKGLVVRPADWRFSSAAYYATADPGRCEVPITRIAW
jgi:putative transposase